MIPQTPAQRIFVTVLMLSGALLYGYIIGAVSALPAAANERWLTLYHTIMKLNAFLASLQAAALLQVQFLQIPILTSRHWTFVLCYVFQVYDCSVRAIPVLETYLMIM